MSQILKDCVTPIVKCLFSIKIEKQILGIQYNLTFFHPLKSDGNTMMSYIAEYLSEYVDIDKNFLADEKIRKSPRKSITTKRLDRFK